MLMSRTKALACKLGLLKRNGLRNEGARGKKMKSSQLFTYVLVIDFEATCWQEKRTTQEIIEFPAVLIDVTSGEVIREFHQYVQPQENPRLSAFCKELTGITQDQVDGGLPLPTCLMIFNKWVKELGEGSSITLVEPGHQYSEDTKLCAIATWTDWDLGVCLKYECSRKHIRRPSYFDHWINLKMLYKTFYERAPSGLAGALEDLGIKFTGRQHSGLDDARNTSRLCYRMAKDGCQLCITKSIHIPPLRSVVRPPANAGPISCGGGPVGHHGNIQHHGSEGHHDKGRPKDDEPNPGHLSDRLDPKNQTGGVDFVACPQTGAIPEQHIKQDDDGPSPPGEPMKHCGTWSEQACASTEGDILDEREKELDELFGSVTRELDLHLDDGSAAASRESAMRLGKTAEFSNGRVASLVSPVLAMGMNSCGKAELKSCVAPTTTLKMLQSPSCVLGAKNHQNCRQSGSIPSGDLLKELFSPPTDSVTPQRLVSSIRPPPSSMDTPHRYISPSIVTLTKISMPQETDRTSLSATVTPPTGGRGVETKSMILTTPIQTSSSALGGVSRGGNPTPPLCQCGRRAKRQTVSTPGPNDGRHFFACPLGKTCSSKKGCGFFKWVDSSSTHVVTSPDLLSSEYDDA